MRFDLDGIAFYEYYVSFDSSISRMCKSTSDASIQEEGNLLSIEVYVACANVQRSQVEEFGAQGVGFL